MTQEEKVALIAAGIVVLALALGILLLATGNSSERAFGLGLVIAAIGAVAGGVWWLKQRD